MNWDDIKIFLTVARAGSVTRAASRLGVRHSTVSRRLRRFEEQLGVRLFDRKRTGYLLTAAGEDLAGTARRMEREFLSIDDGLLGRDEDLRGVLRVSTADAMATTFLMPIAAEFAQRHPEVDLRLMVSNDYISLAQREADVAIRASNTPPDGLLGKRIARLAFAVYGTHGYVSSLADGTPPTWISAEGDMPFKSWIRRRTEGHRIQLTVDEATLTHTALLEGRSVGLMPCFMGDTDPRLVRYEAPTPETDLELWILVHSDLKRTARVRVFRDFVTERLLQQLELLEGRVGGGVQQTG